MSDYVKTTNFTAKDALGTGDPDKLIKGSLFDTEYDAIAVAVATKYDSSTGAVLTDVAALADPGADRILFWDDSATDTTWLTVGTGLAISTTTLALSHLGIESLTDPNADRILFWDDSAGAAAWLTVSTGLAISTTSISLSHLGIQSLSDPNADRVLFWDDSAGATAWLTMGNGLAITDTTIAWSASGISGHDTFTDFVLDEHVLHAGVSVITANRGLSASNDNLSSNIGLEVDITSCTNIEASALATGDEFIVDQSGTPKAIAYGALGMIVQAAQTTQTLAAADANTIMEFDAAATVTIPVDATHTWTPGASCLICVDHASAAVTITAAATVVLNSIFHPGGAAAASDTVIAGGTAALIYLGSDEWYLVGDIAT